MDTCITPNQLNAEFDKISEFFIQHYNKNIETQLNTDDQQLLDEIADKLNEIATTQNIKFNKDGFKTFIKKLYVYDSTQFGGGPPDEIVPYSEKKSYLPNKYDLTAIIMLIASIFMIYISYVKFNDLSQSIIGMSMDEVAQEAQSQVQDAISKIRQLPTEQITFLQYVWQSIQTFGCSIVQVQKDKIQNIITETLITTIDDFADIAQEICNPKHEIMKEGVALVMGFDVGLAINRGVQALTFGLTALETTACVGRIGLENTRHAAAILAHQQALMFNQLSVQSTQSIAFLIAGTTVGTPAMGYLSYRAKDVLGIAYEQFRNQTPRIENSRENSGERKAFRALNGGNRKKNTRKNTKKNKNKNKNRKNKNRKTFRKSRVKKSKKKI